MDDSVREKIDSWQKYRDKEYLEELIKKYNISAIDLLNLIAEGMQKFCPKNLMGCNDLDFGEELNEKSENIREYLGKKYPFCEEICQHHFCVKYNKLFVDTSVIIEDKYNNKSSLD